MLVELAQLRYGCNRTTLRAANAEEGGESERGKRRQVRRGRSLRSLDHVHEKLHKKKKRTLAGQKNPCPSANSASVSLLLISPSQSSSAGGDIHIRVEWSARPAPTSETCDWVFHRCVASAQICSMLALQLNRPGVAPWANGLPSPAWWLRKHRLALDSGETTDDADAALPSSALLSSRRIASPAPLAACRVPGSLTRAWIAGRGLGLPRTHRVCRRPVSFLGEAVGCPAAA